MSLDQYEAVCRERFDELNQKIDKAATKDQVSQLGAQMTTFNNKMFIDNGKPCYQTRLDRNERLWKVTVWVITVICAASIAQAVRTMSDYLNDDKAKVANELSQEL